MRTKLLLLVVFAMSNTLFAQTLTVGDYRSAGPGPAPWNNAASWEICIGDVDSDGDIDWIPATNYPGQLSGGEYDIEIQFGHTISNPNITNPIEGTLTINGTLLLTAMTSRLSTNAVIVTEGQGQINFDGNGNGNLYLPANSSISVQNGGLLPIGEEGDNCPASKRIWIGTFLLSSCSGTGQGNPLAFFELTAFGGSLLPIINYTNPDCEQITLNASYLGTTGSDPNPDFFWTIRTPVTETVYDSPINVNPYTVDLIENGVYQITLTYIVPEFGGLISSKIDYDSRIFLWDGDKWSPDVSPVDPSTLLPWKPEIYSRAKILTGTTYDINNVTTPNAKSFSACNLIIENGATVIIKSNTYIETTNDITNNGTLIVESGGSLVQINDNATFSGSGTSTHTRVSRGMKPLDYVYWGSPVSNNPNPQPLSLVDTTHFDQFYTWNISGAQTGIWAAISATPAVGNGFIARVRLGHVSPNTTQMVFGGTAGSKFNSGPITVDANVFDGGNVDIDSGNSVLLANPYPSAINATTLIQRHPQIHLLKFWTSVTLYTGSGPYQVFDYADYNLSGGTEPSTAPGNLALKPQGYIASGQGFFAQVTADGPIVFNNDMRVRGVDEADNPNNQFFRTSDSETTKTFTESEKNRLWINLSNRKDAYRQMMMGYIEGATNNFDYQYDGASFTTNEIDIYTVLENKELAIQGRGLPFNNSDIIPLGYRVTNAGMYAITLSETDGLFKEYGEIYLKDKVTQTLHNLKKGSYEFHAQAGTFNNRFEIHFREQPLENNPIAHENNLVIFGANKALNVNSYESNIQSVELFDLVGKRIFSASELNVESYVSPSITAASPLLIARVTLVNNQVVTKKVILK